ncbi:iron ABC transporter ATP-binding protein [Paracoccus aminophilus]|uniref:ABC cobalamin/Fe3+-siderophore transporter, ATPase subunit n=1 Tax=Paracoccus aminophilus JCM 7686 TaxID=1367847 RepID=S5Y743_PARAH|nr:ATP-binding cassette domain-containing protein [Paracoccus aminophilus]AGT11375.1 ABC cobalamin/Fe3+-siderophore transporter, ATPase subunit [Paracoccus aminophilus JCM 7686]
MIRVQDVGYRIGAAQILSEISTELPRGKLTALIGPNGAGKSTLLKLITRLERLQSGRVEIDALDLQTTPTETLALKMAVLSQQTVIASRLRLSELVSFGRWPHHRGRPSAQDRARVALALETFGLTPLANRFLDEVSGGQAQRAFLAMTFAQETDWLLLDEPLNNLDVAHSRALMQRLHELVRQENKSIVVVIHEVNYAAAWADHIVAMKDGRILAEGTPQEVLTESVLSTLYDVPVAVGTHQGRPLVLHHI